MPTIFDEITGEIAPPTASEGAAPARPDAAPQPDLAEALRHELQIIRERERRLLAD